VTAVCDRSENNVIDYNQLKSHQLNVNSAVSHAARNTHENRHSDYVDNGYCSYRDVSTSESDLTNSVSLPSVILSRRNEKERKRVRYTVIIMVVTNNHICAR